MAFVPSPEAAAATQQRLPGEIVRLFLARTYEYGESLADKSDTGFNDAVAQAVDRLLGPIRGALCIDTQKPLLEHVSAEVAMHREVGHPDMVLLAATQARVEGAAGAAMRKILRADEYPIDIRMYAVGDWTGYTKNRLAARATLRIVLRRTG